MSAAGSIALDRADGLPAELAAIGPRDIGQVFAGPTLIRVAGERPRPLFLSMLLHGNETTSFFVLRELARRYADAPPPRSLMIFVGNVEAAGAGLRMLPGQPDFNRIWAGGETAWHAMADAVVAEARAANLLASIDIHNNSGANPYYGCVNALRPPDLHLARIFSRLCVYYRNPPTAQSLAFSHFCPAVTLECGKSGDSGGVERALALVEEAMRIETFPDAPPPPAEQRLYETVGAMRIDPAASLAFGTGSADLVLRGDLESLNFVDCAAGTRWAEQAARPGLLTVIDEHGADITDRFFVRDGDGLALKGPATPAMITRDETIVRQDCLGYLMRRL